MLQIRIGAFETNSSSMHSLIWWTDSQFLDLMQEKAYVKRLSSSPGFAYATTYPEDPVWDLAEIRYRYNQNRWKETDPDICKTYEDPLSCMCAKNKIPFLIFLDRANKEQGRNYVMTTGFQHYPDQTTFFETDEGGEDGEIGYLGEDLYHRHDPAEDDGQGVTAMFFSTYYDAECGAVDNEADWLIKDIQKISNSTDEGEHHV